MLKKVLIPLLGLVLLSGTDAHIYQKAQASPSPLKWDLIPGNIKYLNEKEEKLYFERNVIDLEEVVVSNDVSAFPSISTESANPIPEVEVKGFGIAPPNINNPAQKKLMAIRAAEVDAYRKLSKMSGTKNEIKGTRVVDIKYFADGTAEVTIKMIIE